MIDHWCHYPPCPAHRLRFRFFGPEGLAVGSRCYLSHEWWRAGPGCFGCWWEVSEVAGEKWGSHLDTPPEDERVWSWLAFGNLFLSHGFKTINGLANPIITSGLGCCVENMLAGQQSQIWPSSEPNTMVGADYNLYHWSNAYLPLRGKLFKKKQKIMIQGDGAETLWQHSPICWDEHGKHCGQWCLLVD